MRRFITDSIQLVDMVAWVLTGLFFIGSALIFGGDPLHSLLGAVGVVLIMFVVGAAIEVLIETLKNIPGIGTITGFLTNGPEALVVIVGLVGGDILFASSTPLGSNFMNPILLFFAAVLTGHVRMLGGVAPLYFFPTLFFTALLAGGFYLLTPDQYGLWVGVVLAVSAVLFWKRPAEAGVDEEEELAIHKYWLLPAALVLVVAGYFLDPVVAFASEASKAPKGVIGFVVLSTLTSWPEFKSVSALLRRDLALASILNIAVSNITNLWLAAGGVVVYLLM